MQLTRDTSDAELLARYRRFSQIAADWFWELDAELRYVHFEGRPTPLTDFSHDQYIGQLRSEQIESTLGMSEAVAEHNRLLHAHKPIDIVLSMEVSEGIRKHMQVNAEPIVGANGLFQGYHGCGRDVTHRVRLRERYVKLALHDELTGVFNRRQFRTRLEAAHADAHANASVEHSLCMLDLDRFKLVNDTAGHAAGDQLLKELALIMRRFIAPTETLARLGGDEFALLLESSTNGARHRMELLIDAIADHEFVWDERPYSVGASIGITRLDEGSNDVETFIDRADSACYAAKSDGRNRCIVFTPESPAYIRYRNELAQIEVIKEALHANRLRLFMQSIEPVAGEGSRPHHEILLRLESRSGELMAPATFIPVAERFGFMQEIDLWVIEHCLDTISSFAASGNAVSLSINLSGNTLSDRGSLECIFDMIANSAVDPTLLCFEITESAAIRNIDAVIAFMHRMKAIGVRFALDDFGAGLSSFTYIRSLPIDFLKIDGYFIRNIRSDATNRAITAAFIQLSRELGIATVAEFVEDKATRRTVAEMGIDYVQGYGVSRPADVDSVLADLLQLSINRDAAA